MQPKSGFFSFTVIAKKPVGIPSPMVFLDTGLNVFAAQIDDLELFKILLGEEGVEIKGINCLDEFETPKPGDIFLPDELVKLGPGDTGEHES